MKLGPASPQSDPIEAGSFWSFEAQIGGNTGLGNPGKVLILCFTTSKEGLGAFVIRG